MTTVAIPITHCIWPERLTGRSRQVALALCGRFIHEADSTTEPTCPICRQVLDDLEAEPSLTMRT